MPITTNNVRLCARLQDGTIVKGETNIDIRKVRPDLSILDIFLDGETSISQKARRAIESADLIILGPGDLYTSILPNLLVEDSFASEKTLFRHDPVKLTRAILKEME